MFVKLEVSCDHAMSDIARPNSSMYQNALSHDTSYQFKLNSEP